MDSSKDKIKELIGVFYRNTFKIFYINSCEGENFAKPLGYFVSLGITTSPKVLEDMRQLLEENGYTARIAEISSKRVGGQFLNTLINVDNPQQYKLSEFENNILTEETSKKRLEDMKSKISLDQDLDVLKDLVPKISQLEELITKLDKAGGWNMHLIQESTSGFSIFHKMVNYKKVGDLEYRLGIYVSGSSK